MRLGKLYRAMPKSIQKIFKPYVVFRSLERQNKEIKENYRELSQMHIQNLKVVLNRDELLKLMPKNGVITEIGVNVGSFTEKLLEYTQPLKIHLVDLWGSERYPEEKYSIVLNKFSEQIKEDKIEIHRGFSTTVLKDFPNEYFDWVYLDSDHGYRTTYDELIILKDKIKQGGVIAGHDYCRFASKGNARFGVVEAVNKFCVEYDYELFYLTAETHRHLSFAIRKIHS